MRRRLQLPENLLPRLIDAFHACVWQSAFEVVVDENVSHKSKATVHNGKEG